MKDWSNLAKIIYKRTYARKDNGVLENWEDTVRRYVHGNTKDFDVSQEEKDKLIKYGIERKGIPAGRGIWFSGSPQQDRIGGKALNNCWGIDSANWENFVLAQDLLMTGGGVGLSVEHKFVSKLPKVKPDVKIVHKGTNDADFIVPDSREGWCDLTYRVLESFFKTGKSFSYSTVCVRGYGQPIKGFGGTASGPIPLVNFVENLCTILQRRQGKHIRPIDAGDIICATGEMVVAGNVRRSAIILLGDPWDKEYLHAKRWDLGTIPSYRSCANYSVICEDVEDLHPSFWKTYQHGEPFGIVNRKAIQAYGRMGEIKKDSAWLTNPCVVGDTLILTDKGYKKIKDCEGNKELVWNGFEWSTVVPMKTGENQPLMEIKFSSGQTLICTPAHKFHLQNGKDVVVKRADELNLNDKLIKHDRPILHSNNDWSNAYSQGFYAGDGDSGGSLILVYKPKYPVISRLNSSYIGKEDTKQNRIRVKLNFNVKEKTYVPFDLSVASKLDWLAGLVDSDGSLTTDGSLQVGSIHEEFLLDVQLMLTTLGCSSKVTLMYAGNIKDIKGKLYKCQPSYRLLIGAAQVESLYNLGMRCSRIDLSSVKPDRDATRFITPTSIKLLDYTEDVYCYNEPKRHLGFFNGVLTGNCAEACLECYEPCVSGDTQIITKNSIQPIASLLDKPVEIWNGSEWSTVTPRITGYNRELYRVKFGDGSYLDCTSNHKFSVKNRFESEWKKVTTLEIEKLLLESKYTLQIQPTTLPYNTDGKSIHSPYTLGVAVGDGSIDKDTVYLFLYGVKQTLPVEGEFISEINKSDRLGTVVRVKTDLNHSLVSSLKSDPSGFKYLEDTSTEDVLKFVAGLADTDGSLAGNGIRIYISQENRARHLQLILTKNGVKSSVNLFSKAGSTTNKGVRKHDLWYLQLDGENSKKIPTSRLNPTGNPVRSKGKYQTVRSIEKLEGLHTTYCFDEPLKHMGMFNNVLTYQCNLQEIPLMNLDSEDEFVEVARLLHRYGKRVSLAEYHDERINKVVHKNYRIGTGITGCLASTLFNPKTLDRVYDAIQKENEAYSKTLGIPESIRTTVVKPSGTVSKVTDQMGYEGIHPAFSKYMIQRVRFAANDPLVGLLQKAGHVVEPEQRLDNTVNHGTMVVDFYQQAPEGYPVADGDWDTWRQLETLKMAQKHWADQAVSVTVYYKKDDIPKIKEWLATNLSEIKTISFLCHNDHGFIQAPKEAISEEQYHKLSKKVSPIDVDEVSAGDLESMECEGGACPIK